MRRYAHYLIKMGPRWFRRSVVDMYPNPDVQNIKEVVDTMSAKSYEIFNQKKVALKRGDEAVLRQVGEGKDIMSILSTFSFPQDKPKKKLTILCSHVFKSRRTRRHLRTSGFLRVN